jgi:glycosyltransferase involved in cell wall biosynthesis
MKATICLITSAQPSANPRLLKEAKTLFSNGYKVNVIWCPISPWADEFDKELFNEFPKIKWIKAGYHAKKEPFRYLLARMRQKIWQLIYRQIGDHFGAAIKSYVLFSQELKEAALKCKAELYIGHNLGSLPAIVRASKKLNAKSIFDLEDFHRGESDAKSYHFKFVSNVEGKFIPLVNILTAASPAITGAYKSIFSGKEITTINNVFPIQYATEKIKELPQKPLKVFWFSQFVGKKRGIENVIKAISLFQNDEIIITLLGSCSNEVKNYFLSLASSYNLIHDQLIFLNSVNEKDIVKVASQHHIGLASEISDIPNRDLCLTNKIFMYMLAGNALVLSDTNAQKDFLETYPGVGLLYNQDYPSSLKSLLQKYMDDPELLNQHRLSSLQVATKQLNWDVEGIKWMKLVNKMIG